MDWIVGLITLLAMDLLARGKWQGWLVGLVNQVGWLLLSLDRELYGLLPLTVLMTVQYTWALVRWRRDAVRWRSPGSRPQGARQVLLELDRWDYDAVQNAIARQSVAMGFPPERDPEAGQGNAAGEAIAEICRGWMELREA